MKTHFLILATALMITGIAHGDIMIEVYSGHSTVEGGAPFSGLVGTFTSPDIMFASMTGDYAWHPFGLSDFGALMTGCLDVASDDTYTFSLNSDDGSLLYIDGALVVNNGGLHGPTTESGSTFLRAGQHSFMVQFFQDFGEPSGIDLHLPTGVAYGECVPTPGAFLLGVLGLGVAGRKLRRRITA